MPLKALVNNLARFKAAEVVWVQEEPKNMGAWTHVDPYFDWVLSQTHKKQPRLRYIGRPAAAATATGLMSKHLAQMKAFTDEAFAS
jgi:2-oxoglutarate dehydrogenase E1 component